MIEISKASTQQHVRPKFSNYLINYTRDGLDEARKVLESVKHERDKSILTDIVEREKNINAIEGEVVKARKRYDR